MSRTPDPAVVAPFDLKGPLPTGMTVLEASAGTGKTYTIAALATRYVAAGKPLERLLLVTFTRVATSELRERVRERLVHTESELARILSGAPASRADEVVELLASGPPETVEQHRSRLAHAVANFDAATIETTHGFCQRVLDGLGTLGDTDPDVSFVENVDDLVSQVVDDLYVRRFYRKTDQLSISRREAGLIAEIAIENPTAVIHPLNPDGGIDGMRARLAAVARSEYEARKRSLGVMTHDDQLTRLLATLTGASGPAAITKLQAQYDAVLIDEFQDTDPVQWEIVRRAFDGGGVALVLIGDPKQAIYAFRGADVYAYLDAAGAARQRATLDVNRRSDATLLHGLDALFGHARLGHPEIVYRQVSPASGHAGSRLLGAPVAQALRMRMVAADEPAVNRTGTGYASAPSAREFIARDLAVDVVSLLSSGAQIEQRSEDGQVTGTRPVAPGQIAVLVRSHYQADLIQKQLEAVGVPAVIGGSGSVFATAAAADWEVLLKALERPSHPGRARAAALTPFIGMRSGEVALADEAELEALHRRLYAWARVLREHGVAALSQQVFTSEHVAARLLAEIDGERHLTDLEHVAELMHAASASGHLGLTALTGWLRERITAAGREGANDALTRRLDSDADAVQVLTFHRSKGLEFPFVYCPFLWDARRASDRPEPIYFHDPDAGNLRAIDVGLTSGGYRRHQQLHNNEERGEELRLAYVALTRARHQAVVWWACAWTAKDSPLGRLLLAQDADGNVAPEGANRPREAHVLKRLHEIRELAPHAVSVEEARPAGLPREWSEDLGRPDELRAAAFERRLDTLWRRTSYSAITAAAHDALVGSEPEEQGVTDEPAGPPPTESAELPLSSMASGPQLGTLIHRAFEQIDFDGAELEADLSAYLREYTEHNAALLGCAPQDAAAGLATALRTPLGGELGALRLVDVTRADRLDELSFELPLSGGDEPVTSAALADVAVLLRAHLGPGDPLAGYATRLGDPSLSGVLRGYLTGSIDLVLRSHDGAGRARYSVIDYKTNWLAPAGEPLQAWHYRPAALAEEMQRSHYALQALLYAAALHRYLRWRVADYDPERDLAGVHYLFVRGMLGGVGSAGASGSTGVFAWHPPAELIVELSDLLDGRR